MPGIKRKAKASQDEGFLWKLDPASKKAVKDAVENADPNYVNMLAGRIAQKLSAPGAAHRNIPARETRPSITNELGGLGFDLVRWVHQHPYRLIAMSLGLAGGMFLFLRAVNHYFGKK